MGSVKIVGELILDYTRVRFHGTIELATLRGTGRLEPLEDVEPGAAAPPAGPGKHSHSSTSRPASRRSAAT